MSAVVSFTDGGARVRGTMGEVIARVAVDEPTAVFVRGQATLTGKQAAILAAVDGQAATPAVAYLADRAHGPYIGIVRGPHGVAFYIAWRPL